MYDIFMQIRLLLQIKSIIFFLLSLLCLCAVFEWFDVLVFFYKNQN